MRTRLRNRIGQGFSPLEKQMGIVQVHDCVLHYDSRKHHDTHEGHHVKGDAEEEKSIEHAGDGERD